MPVYRLDTTIAFPPPQLAREDGLLAVGGDLSVERLILAYQLGIFPWYSPGEPILWWSPDPRLVLFPDDLLISKRLARTIRKNKFTIRLDTAFREVIYACGQTRVEGGQGTWINEELLESYCRLHELGYAHSVEAWQDGKLVGGLYGISMGRIFYGESMFSLAPDSSKVALAALIMRLKEWHFGCIDCQVRTEHLIKLGAREIPGADFHQLLAIYLPKSPPSSPWR